MVRFNIINIRVVGIVAIFSHDIRVNTRRIITCCKLLYCRNVILLSLPLGKLSPVSSAELTPLFDQ